MIFQQAFQQDHRVQNFDSHSTLLQRSLQLDRAADIGSQQ